MLYRMAMPDHLCPYSLKSKALLEWKGYQVEDKLLTTRDETDAFRDAHGVKTTPQTFIDGERVGVTNPMGTNARDLEHFVNLLGFTPMEAIVAATGLRGELMGEPDALGQLKPGFHTDLLAVDGDPLKDIAILQDADRLAAIMIGGRLAKCKLH